MDKWLSIICQLLLHPLQPQIVLIFVSNTVQLHCSLCPSWVKLINSDRSPLTTAVIVWITAFFSRGKVKRMSDSHFVQCWNVQWLQITGFHIHKYVYSWK